MANNQEKRLAIISFLEKEQLKKLQEELRIEPEINKERLKTLKQENKNLELENEKLEQDIKQRKKFFICSSVILFSWIIFIIILTIAQFMIKIFFCNFLKARRVE